VAIFIVIGVLYSRYGAMAQARGAIDGLGAGAAGLVAATAIKMAWPLLRRRPVTAPTFLALAFAGVGLARLPLPWVLLGLAPLSIAVVWRDPR
jgi:chromate transporter